MVVTLVRDGNVDAAPPDFLYCDKDEYGLLTSLVVSSRTTLFSLGVRPVFRPDDTFKAPLSVGGCECDVGIHGCQVLGEESVLVEVGDTMIK